MSRKSFTFRVCTGVIIMSNIRPESMERITTFGGGKGAVRDIVEQVLRSQDEWAKDRQGVLGVASR